MFATIAALTLAASQAAAPLPLPAPAAAPNVEQQNDPRLRTAAQLLKDHQPDQALAVAESAIAVYDADHAGEKRRLYCSMSGPETLLYLAMASKDKVEAVALPPGYCLALYFKGFALVDLGRVAEAKAVYARLTELAPEHAQFITEQGQLARLDKDWPRMLATCERGTAAAALTAPAEKIGQQTAALRCQGFALVELHRLDEAERRYREALALDPHDARAAGELRYIADQRAKR